jgi:DNA-binding IclR family transcriptional regulator
LTFRSPTNRSLERGIEILRAFRPGSELLGNGDLVDRTGLPKGTISRLTHTLVDAGFLEHDEEQRAYRLAVPVLSLALAMRTASMVLRVAAPLMQATSERHRINVGLAAPDRDEMVYLESIRYNRRVSLRTVVAGQRVPIELTSLGRAYLAALPRKQRRTRLMHLRDRRPSRWETMEAGILKAVKDVETKGFCHAAWQPGVLAVATPLVLSHQGIFVLNVSTNEEPHVSSRIAALSIALLELETEIREAFEAFQQN